MDKIDFHALNESERKMMLEAALGNKGKCVEISGGMCGEIYKFDQGANVSPRYVCAKIPKPLNNCSKQIVAKRFVNELKLQLSFYHHMFVHWAFDFTEVLGVPVALFRYWENDLDNLICNFEISDVQKLSIMVYICAGLRHCYNNGLVAHQDLKPANIFLRDIKGRFPGLPDLDIYNFALVADFGLANASVDSGVFAGSRPYMAPEQWEESDLSPSTDVFALGVILYELMTSGYHPVGIKLRDFWPQPLNGNGKKWTRPNPWRKWATQIDGCCIEPPVPIDPVVLSLIQAMLSVDPAARPTIDEVTNSLLRLVRSHCEKSYNQIEFLLSYFDNQISTESLEKKWPYLADKWNSFEAKFG